MWEDGLPEVSGPDSTRDRFSAIFSNMSVAVAAVL